MTAQFEWDNLGIFKGDKAFVANYSADTRSFWTERDDIHGVLVALLSSAQHSIILNMYGYDDPELDSIIKQKMQMSHIFVQMSLDSTQYAGKHESELMSAWPRDAIGTTIAYGRSAKHAISHLKVVIVDGLYTVKGSTNWSLNGENRQDNEVSICNNSGIAAETRSILDINHAEMLKQMAAAR